MAYTVISEIGFATAEDGARLDWEEIYVPDPVQFPGPRPAVLMLVSSGFDDNKRSPGRQTWSGDLANRGVIVFKPTVRLANEPTRWLPGQTVKGTWPRQDNDVKRAALAILADARCNGKYVTCGGSGGATIACIPAIDTRTLTVPANPVPWDTTKRPLGAVCLSLFAEFSDRTPDDNLNYVISVVENYTGSTNLEVQHTMSPTFFVTSTAKPIFMVDGGDHEKGDPGNDSMPAIQRILMGQALTAAGVTNYQSTHLPAGGHSFGLYNLMPTTILDWIMALFDGGPPPPPPPPPPPTGGPLNGLSALMAANITVSSAIATSPAVDIVSLRLPWYNVQPSPIAFDFSYFQTQIANVLALDPKKRFILLVQTGGGTRHFGDFKPNWLFTLLATNGRVLSGGTATAGSPSITTTGNFSAPDVGKRVSVTASLNGAIIDVGGSAKGVPLWIGTVSGVDPKIITLSTSPTSNVPYNALKSASDATVEVWTEGAVAFDSHTIVPGVTYSYDDKPGVTTTILPFWHEVLQRRKRLLYTKMGEWLASLPPDQKAAVVGVRGAFVNGNGDDWYIPEDNKAPEATIYTEHQFDRWVNLPAGTPPGAGYTTQKMIDTAVTTQASDQTFTTGTLSSTKQLRCREAGFSVLDIGKEITGVGIGPGNKNTINSIAAGDDQNGAIAGLRWNGVAGAVTFTIPQRLTGMFDVMMAAFPGLAVGGSIAQNLVIDKTAAQAAGDPDFKNFLARSVNNVLQARYKPRFWTQKNGVSATTIRAEKPPGPTTGYGFLLEIANSGAPVGGQALWRVYQDPLLLMNNGSRDDRDYTGPPPIPQLTDQQILERSGGRIVGYKAKFYEVYAADVTGLPAGALFIHNLLVPPGPPPPPPPPPPPIPEITSPLTATAEVGSPFSYQITATGNPTSFGALGLPAGLSINTSTGLISGTPTGPPAFNINVPILATNGSGTGSAVLKLTVDAQPIPVITSGKTASAKVNVPFSYKIIATGNPTSFNATNLPAGLSVNTLTGLISGTPTVLGVTMIPIFATNGSGTGSAVLTLTVITDLPLPEITSPLTASAKVGTPFSYQITATGDPYQFTAAPLPPGLFLADASTGLIIGTPTAAGVTSVLLQATNLTGTGTATMVLTVAALPPPPPPPPPAPLPVEPPRVEIEAINFLEGVLHAIADLLGIDTESDLNPARGRRWISKIHHHLHYAWDLHDWPELMLTEERAFRPIYNAARQWEQNAEVYWLNAPGYYRAKSQVPPDYDPSDKNYWRPITLTANDYYIPVLQRCRQRLGAIDEVYPTDPRDVTRKTPRALPWQMSGRGLEVFRYGGATVFVRYRIVPYRYTSEPFSAAKVYKANGLALDADGEVYRRIIAGSGLTKMDATIWSLVPFPRFLADYVTYMVASDEAADAINRRDFRGQAKEFLARSEDELLEIGVRPQRYRLTAPRRRLWTPVTTVFGVTDVVTKNTIYGGCLNEWGDVIPKG